MISLRRKDRALLFDEDHRGRSRIRRAARHYLKSGPQAKAKEFADKGAEVYVNR
jgi:hypothetical protein